MPNGMTKLTIVGNLTKDPTITMTKNGRAKANLNVAVNTSFKNARGDWDERADFYFVEVWGSSAEFVAKYGRKGDQVTIEGHLSTWKPEGEQYAKTQLVGDLVFLPSGATKRSLADAVDSRDDFGGDVEYPDDINF